MRAARFLVAVVGEVLVVRIVVLVVIIVLVVFGIVAAKFIFLVVLVLVPVFVLVVAVIIILEGFLAVAVIMLIIVAMVKLSTNSFNSFELEQLVMPVVGGIPGELFVQLGSRVVEFMWRHTTGSWSGTFVGQVILPSPDPQFSMRWNVVDLYLTEPKFSNLLFLLYWSPVSLGMTRAWPRGRLHLSARRRSLLLRFAMAARRSRPPNSPNLSCRFFLSSDRELLLVNPYTNGSTT